MRLENSMAKNILICGVGGQGTVLAAKVISQAAVSGGKKVLSAETIGMAQRGGSVTSHVRIGDEIFSPLIPKGQADLIIAFEAAEAVRNIEYLKKGGTAVINSKIVQPTTASLTGETFEVENMLKYLQEIGARTVTVDADSMSKKIGSSKVVNMILLGTATQTGVVTKEEVLDAIKLLVKPDFYELNVKAVEEGSKVLMPNNSN